MIGKFLIKLNTAIVSHKWFDGDTRQMYEATFHDPKTAALKSLSINLIDPEVYDSIPSVSYLLQHERPGTCANLHLY